MAQGKDGTVARQLRTLFSVGTIRELTDGQLLERFANARGEAAELAFAVLLERHGPMVLRVCRAVLAGDPQDAEDAFQATFLVLVRRARGLWVRDSLGPWLHQVACRTAWCARSAAARRRRHEQRAGIALGTRSNDATPDDELGRLLHEEINGLPERYRAPLILCDLDGSSYEQAARHLGWPVGTVKSRHSRGRQRLRDRLIRRGLAPGAWLIAGAAGPGTAEAFVPLALLEATARAATQLATARTFVSGAVAFLTQGVLRSMITIQWLKAASVLLVLGATASAVDFLAWRATAGAEPQAGSRLAPVQERDDSVVTVQPGTLTALLDRQKGLLESSENEDVFSQVEGLTNIISIVPEGTWVEKGNVVCELDSSGLQDRLRNQRPTTLVAEAAYRNAQRTREVAESAVVEYAQGKYKAELAPLNAAITVAQSSVLKAELRATRTRNALGRVKDLVARKAGGSTPADIVAVLDLEDRIDTAEDDVARAKMTLEQAQSKREVLEKYTRDKSTKELQSEVEKAKSDELARLQTWTLERDREAKLVKQIMNCKLYAPGVGIVVYANDHRRAARGPGWIGEGAAVRERQKIFSLPNLKKMRVNVNVPESVVARIKNRQPARIRVDAFADAVLTGSFEEINPLPTLRDQAGINVYGARVSIAKGLPGLRPGMSAEVEVLTELDNVLTLPRTAVLGNPIAGKCFVLVKKPDGTLDRREVVLGLSDGDRVEVKQGIQSGELVVLDPAAAVNNEKKVPSRPPAASPDGPG